MRYMEKLVREKLGVEVDFVEYRTPAQQSHGASIPRISMSYGME